MPDLEPQSLPSTKPKRVKGYTRGPAARGARVPVINGTERSLTPKVQDAIKRMVWDRMRMQQAATAVSLTPAALGQALMKPVVVEYLKREIEVFRTAARSGNLSTVLEIRDDDDQPGKTRIEAARYIDGETAKPGVQVNIGLNVTPGYTVIAGSADTGADVQRMLELAGSSRSVIDHMPATTHQPDAASPDTSARQRNSTRRGKST